MALVTMTVYEAMARKKTLEAQLNENKTIYRMVAKKLKANDKETLEGDTLENAEKAIRAAYNSTVALIENYENLVAALHESNAKTTLEIGGKTMTVAEAIGREKYINFEERVYTSMVNTYNKFKAEVDKANADKLDPKNVAAYVEKVLGDSKKDAGLLASTEEAYKKNNVIELFDPVNSGEVGEKKLEELKKFKEQLHSTLTSCNCTTTITVEFAD
jgi:hypothetical protein